jgi:hypothetical protein
MGMDFLLESEDMTLPAANKGKTKEDKTHPFCV